MKICTLHIGTVVVFSVVYGLDMSCPLCEAALKIERLSELAQSLQIENDKFLIEDVSE
jgi:hypothetical protein